ncbi:uncharacterized protein VP01_845g4 [Puccinia sorghi]|uniref:Trehalose 6-phosphate phosphatase n=1 Tax=Puccinia sorghi TaxID=27349 RepID=A0A0L6U9D5_9BASI|nr:uncharacterized protein VP01_845g4 [Puccinia sorghi]
MGFRMALVGFFTDSAKAAGISNARLFGQSEVFEPTRDLLGHPSYPAQRVQDVDHCENAELFLPGKRLVALDNNGVLIPIGANKDDEESARALLEELGRNSNNEVWVVSGGSLSSLRARYSGIPGVNLAAEHGTVLVPYGDVVQSVSIGGMPEIREALDGIAKRYDKMGMFVFDTQNVIAFKYNSDLYGTGVANAALREVKSILPPQIPLRQEAGKAYGEIKDLRIQKANFVAKLLQSGRFNSGIAMGDQITDEGMFRAMNNHRFYSVIVSRAPNQETRAKNKLNDVEEVHHLLRQLIVSPSGDAVSTST